MVDKKLPTVNKFKDSEQDLCIPESRSLLPDNHNELFGVKTTSFVIANEDIKQERVLGDKF